MKFLYLIARNPKWPQAAGMTRRNGWNVSKLNKGIESFGRWTDFHLPKSKARSEERVQFFLGKKGLVGEGDRPKKDTKIRFFGMEEDSTFKIYYATTPSPLV